MAELAHLFENNRNWSRDISRTHKGFFECLSSQQAPDYLWIGCSDSRVPANELIGLMPGEVFVHRNVANLVVHTDFNCLSVIQYAVSILRVKHIIICGHYDCGGVKAALTNRSHGFIDNWLRHLRDLYHLHGEFLDRQTDPKEKEDRLCELNVVSQVRNVCQTTMVRAAWTGGQPLTVHGWIYTLSNGLLRDMNVSVSGPGEADDIYRKALGRITGDPGDLKRVTPIVAGQGGIH